MNKKILSWLESLMEEEALGLASNPYQEAMKKSIAEQAAAQVAQEAVQPTAPTDLGNQQMANVISDLTIYNDFRHTGDYAKQIGGVDTLRHPDANGMHFGNPFSPNVKSSASIYVPSIKDSVIAFSEWLKGNPKYAQVEPERRQWIVDQINNGSLKGKPLVYYTNKIPDMSYGTNMYNSKTAPNHAHVLLDMINNGITPYQSNEQLLSKLANSTELPLPKDLGEAQFNDNELLAELGKYNNSIQNEYNVRRKALDDLLNFASSNKALTPVHKERMLKRIPIISNNLNKLTPEKISFSDMQKTYNDLDKNVYQKYTDEKINNYINRLDRATDLDVSDMLESANNYNELSEEDLDYYLNLLKTISRNRRF